MVNVSAPVALTYWERWRADAEARERGRSRLPGKPKLAKCENIPRSAQRFGEDLEKLRHVLARDCGIAKGRA
jgi:hypothetical protein